MRRVQSTVISLFPRAARLGSDYMQVNITYKPAKPVSHSPQLRIIQLESVDPALEFQGASGGGMVRGWWHVCGLPDVVDKVSIAVNADREDEHVP